VGNGSVAAERRMALHDLIDRILITRAEEPEAYRRIYLHEKWLRNWLMDRLQWRIIAGPGFYRLERLPSHALPGRGLPRFREPMDYACLCWVLWYAETHGASAQNWFVISELAAAVARASGGLFRLGERAHREALARALQLLVDLGVVVHRDGDVDRWVGGAAADGEPPEVLYEFAETAPRLLAHFDPAGLEALAGRPEASRTLPPTGEAAPPLVRAWRALVLGPHFWRADDPEGFEALVAARDQVAGDLERDLGWELELADEYARIWRTTTARGAAGVLLDLVPEPGEETPDRHVRYIYHPILLLMDRIRAEVAAGRLAVDPDGAVAITGGQIRDLLSELFDRYRRNWGAELGSQVSLPELQRRVMQQMRVMGYLRGPDPLDRCWILPPAAQVVGAYRPAAPGPDEPGGAPAPDHGGRQGPTGRAGASSPPAGRQLRLFEPEEDRG